MPNAIHDTIIPSMMKTNSLSWLFFLINFLFWGNYRFAASCKDNGGPLYPSPGLPSWLHLLQLHLCTKSNTVTAEMCMGSGPVITGVLLCNALHLATNIYDSIVTKTSLFSHTHPTTLPPSMTFAPEYSLFFFSVTLLFWQCDMNGITQ